MGRTALRHHRRLDRRPHPRAWQPCASTSITSSPAWPSTSLLRVQHGFSPSRSSRLTAAEPATRLRRLSAIQSVNLPFISGGRLFGWRSPDVAGWIENRHWFLISDIAALIRGIGREVSFATLIILALVPLSAWILWRTRFGLRLRSSGEAPAAASSLGVNIPRLRYQGMAISGALAGLGGAFLSIVAANLYREGQTGGQGFIGLATTIFGNWRPTGVLSGGILFGFATALRLRDAKNVPALFLVLAIALLIMGDPRPSQTAPDRRSRVACLRHTRRHWLHHHQRAPPVAHVHHAARDHPDRARHRLTTTTTAGIRRQAVPRRRIALATAGQPPSPSLRRARRERRRRRGATGSHLLARSAMVGRSCRSPGRRR